MFPTPDMKIRFYLILIIIVFLIGNAIFSLLGSSYIPTHDGEYHIIRFVEFSKMLSAGYLLPRWAPELNSGYGIPIFQFHYPLPNYIGSIIRLVTQDAVYAFQWSLALGYVLILFGFLYWLLCYFPLQIAVLGAVIGSYTPYIFLDIYVRGVIGEVFAIGLFGFLLGSIERKKYLLSSVLFALLIISHNISAMIFGGYLLCFALYRKRQPYFLLFGALLSAYFWIPALFEQKYVVGLNTVNFRDHFVQLYEFLIPSWGTQFSATGNVGNKMSFQIGIIPFIISLIVVIRSYFEPKNQSKTILKFLTFSLCCLLLLFPITAPIWEFIRPLQLVQYPWRLLSLSIPVTAFGASYLIVKRTSLRGTLIILLSMLILTWRYVRPVRYEPRNEQYYTSRLNFTDGTSSMGNSFSTIWSTWKEIKPTASVEVTVGTLSDTKVKKYLSKTIRVTMIEDGIVRFNTLYFPGWKAFIDGKNAEIQYKKDGVIDVVVPKGEHIVHIQYFETPLRLFADIVSIASLIGIAGWGILSLRTVRVNRT